MKKMWIGCYADSFVVPAVNGATMVWREGSRWADWEGSRWADWCARFDEATESRIFQHLFHPMIYEPFPALVTLHLDADSEGCVQWRAALYGEVEVAVREGGVRATALELLVEARAVHSLRVGVNRVTLELPAFIYPKEKWEDSFAIEISREAGSAKDTLNGRVYLYGFAIEKGD